jgi:cholesterol oxidase
MAESAGLGVTDHAGAVFGYEGLYCIDSSIIPTSLGVNPSLTIAAVSERCADLLVRRGADFGLPARPSGLNPGVPREVVGERVVAPVKPRRRGRRRL